MDKLQWFKFSPSDWMMGKIQRCPEITQARFIRLCCLYWNKESNLLKDDAIIEIDQEHYDILISKKIISDDGAHVFIDFLNEQLEDITELSKSKSKAAKARWEKQKGKKVDSTSNADAMHVHKDAMQNNAEKRREEKRREETPPTPKGDLPFKYDVYLEEINKMFGRNHKVVSDKLKRSIQARLREGYKNINFYNAMVNVKNNDFHKETNYVHVDPYFFAQESKLSKYGDKIRSENKTNKIGATTEYYQHD